ncbi:MAG: 5-formyltetrahydrofolate cyclo-ligase [Verrucomicrobiae bacterium]|nr:5-formyltetrahydrofolate cyclo-ligase [Verrucomicrobiae bacterium]
MDKEATRRELFARIHSLTQAARSRHSAEIRNFLSEDAKFREAKTVFAYLNLPGEPCLDSLVSSFPEKRWAFSRVVDGERIVFHEIRNLEEAIQGNFGIREPDPSRHPELPRSEADLFLVPGVGFDPLNRARIGRGKGHYDRYLEGSGNDGRSVSLIGVTFSIQFTDLILEPHDVPMDRIVSETGWI